MSLAQLVLGHFAIESRWVSLQDILLGCFDKFLAMLMVAALLAPALRSASLTSSKALAVELEAPRFRATALLYHFLLCFGFDGWLLSGFGSFDFNLRLDLFQKFIEESLFLLL